eukprot:Sspe_Gene.39427::Locus_19015_Transcript_1_3_Confidence_0.750_Length_752::g.39427::m.39427
MTTQIGENSRRPLKCLADVSRPMRRKLARWGTALAFVINAVTLFIGWFAWGNVLIFQRETEDYIADAVQMSEFEMVDGSNTLVTNGVWNGLPGFRTPLCSPQPR